MENRPLVSIISPTYNHEKYLVDCIESVLDQTYPNWEMIILNDGSTDRTAEIATSYQDADSRIKLINQENVGIFRLSETYNKGISIARGEYLAVLEGDDCWAPNKLELQVAAFQNDPDAVVCWGMARCVNSDKSQVYYISPNLTTVDAGSYSNDPVGSIMNVILYRNCIPALTIMIKKEALIQIGGFKQLYNLPLVDLPTLYELALAGRFIFIPELLGDWRNYAGQVTKTFPAVMSEGYYRMAISFVKNNQNADFLMVDLKELDRYYAHRMVIAYARSGRYKMIRNEYASARMDYWKAIAGNGFAEPVWKLRAAVGWLFSIFHLDVEVLARILGKKSYTEK
ncbi:MAG TPA: glycosyltransferase family 2 protein [Prolixibacteraceae bacterium]